MIYTISGCVIGETRYKLFYMMHLGRLSYASTIFIKTSFCILDIYFILCENQAKTIAPSRIDRHQQPVKETMSVWMKAADDMYEEALEHMDMQHKRLEDAKRQEAILKYKYHILQELYDVKDKRILYLIFVLRARHSVFTKSLG
ncbi:hypothetical protein DAI22_09g029900 [Oryza sativa Japonica Group]|uniref:cDNA clone:001-117-C03, full insert sequence n=2 Tax=Oryza sativa subsp. japonica TaxID=39947 RepID=Q6H4S6_ORYSJ|nr:hypothetical protein DAI22_09g029900 [Oryza sativa Japonica Group]BAD26273.1 unknown protein [Oryza sativa Japonica Group]BAG88756.1 unnamed protein product [Oryza sativa Japonica Group]